ncbi:MAG: decarboxylating 6-phosphogluconate dehydrogenase [Chloroflexi bacterium]|nr:decarboxylating 6-phosphogluconate dehydrogenase [Chloroflexota bacterium]
MEMGMIGLGRMGGNMTRRLVSGGHRVVAYDPLKATVEEVVAEGAIGATSIPDLAKKLAKPRIVWLMVPAGESSERAVSALTAELSRGDIIIDGGNANYKDSMRRAAALSQKGIIFLDAGVSGGLWGLEEGYCLMVGGDESAFRRVEPLLKTLAPSPEKGYGHVGPSGAGHFVKMVHNGIEYALMESYAEGFEMMKAKSDFSFDLHQVAEIWRYGSVVRSWLLDLTARALEEDTELSDVGSYVGDSGEGRWMVQESVELAVPLPAITQSLQARFRSRQEQPFAGKLLAALRNQFGGHVVKKVKT